MGDCLYCHQKAGLFKTVHAACEELADLARKNLRLLITNVVSSARTTEDLQSQISLIKQSGRLTDSDAQSVMLEAADKASLELSQGTAISNEDAERIGAIFESLDENWHKDAKKLVNWSGYISLLHSNTIYQILHKQVPYIDRAAFSDFRLLPDEHPITRRNTTLAEYRTVPSGRTFQSIGMPIGGGMYYRIGTSQPRTQQTGLVPVDDGLMVITTKAIIYSGQQRNFRLPYSSILRLESFVDGFGVHENYGSGKVFIPGLIGTMDEGWYFYNLVSALMQW